jgi:predicted TIM-barrel fold metal-dependent hydrolase
MNHRVFDSHIHIIDPAYPLITINGYLPLTFTVEDYLRQVSELGVTAGAVVSGSFQGYDQGYLVGALERLGPSFVGVTQIPVSVSDAELQYLNSKRVRGIRFNLKRGGSEGVERLKSFALRVYEVVGWHVELHVESRALASCKKHSLHYPQ